MQQNEFDEFAAMLALVTEQYGKTLSDGLVMLYWQGLRQYDVAAVRAALNAHVMNPDTGQFMPKIADIVRMIHGRTEDQAFAAWSKVDRAVRHVGTYQSVAFDDPLIHRVIHDMGGWIALGAKTEDEWPFVAREFENRYRGYRARGEAPAYHGVLPGIVEAQNQQIGCSTRSITLIGNAEQAARVIEKGVGTPLLGIAEARGDKLRRIAHGAGPERLAGH